MKISVVVPVYNVEDYIISCLESITQQEGTDKIECIIVDDCGSDNSMNLIYKFLSDYTGEIDFKIIHHNANGGLSAARNTGILNSTGEYITFVDSDDKLLEDSIESLSSIAREKGYPDLVQGDIAVSKPYAPNKSLAVSASLFPSFSNNMKWCRDNLLNHIPVTAWAKLIKRDFIVSNKLFYDEGLIHEDEMWRLKASRCVKSIAFCFKPIYYYRNDNENSIMHCKDLTGSMMGRIAVATELISNFDWSNAVAETRYGVEHLIYHVKGDAWSQVSDKRKIGRLLSDLKKETDKSDCPQVLKFMVSYLRLPDYIADNVLVRAIYRRLILKGQNKVFDKC